MKTKFRSVFEAACRPALPVILLTVVAPSSGLAGSLWREAVTDERGMFADKRAHRLGDIVTVVISESAVATNASKLTSARDATGDANGLGTGLINQFINAAQSNGVAIAASDRRQFPQNLLPKPAGQAPKILSTTGTAGFTGGGSITNTQTLVSSMAVQVIDVLPNGNLVIEGIREVSFSKERQFASLRGIIRPADVSATNTVASTAIADARIDVVSEGTLTNSQKKGWLMRLDEKISPY